MCPSLKLKKYALIHPKLMNSFSICLKICKKITFIVDVKDQRTNGPTNISSYTAYTVYSEYHVLNIGPRKSYFISCAVLHILYILNSVYCIYCIRCIYCYTVYNVYTEFAVYTVITVHTVLYIL